LGGAGDDPGALNHVAQTDQVVGELRPAVEIVDSLPEVVKIIDRPS